MTSVLWGGNQAMVDFFLNQEIIKSSFYISPSKEYTDRREYASLHRDPERRSPSPSLE